MLDLKLSEVDVLSVFEPDEPYPNSVLHALDDSFLKGLLPDEPAGGSDTDRGFWQRQTSAVVTPKQKLFDWSFGVIMPAACFFFDPFVFRADGGGALLAKYQLSAYLISGLAIMATVTWLLWGSKLGEFNSFLSGLFAISGFIALMIGIVLFPFSVIGMLFLVGFLGFTPLLTSYVLFRNAIRAYGASIK